MCNPAPLKSLRRCAVRAEAQPSGTQSRNGLLRLGIDAHPNGLNPAVSLLVKPRRPCHVATGLRLLRLR